MNLKTLPIQTLQAVANDGEIIYAEGIEDGYSNMQPIIPLKFFTDQEILDLPSWCHTGTTQVNLGEAEAKDHNEIFERFTVKIVTVDIPRYKI